LGYFFAHQDDVFIAGKFFIESFTESLTVSECEPVRKEIRDKEIGYWMRRNQAKK
jgi:hypothetical protein